MFEKLYLGDSLKIMSEFEDNSIDLIITDPPYKVDQGTGGIYKNRNLSTNMMIGKKRIKEYQGILI